MNIDRVDVIPIQVPNRVPMKLSTGLLEFQENVIVRIRAGDLTGIGETEPLRGFQGCAESQATIVHMIRERFAPLLLGRDPFDIEKIARVLENAMWGNPYAKAGVINALYDLMAKTLKMPLCRLLGGCYRDKIPVVWTIGIKDSNEMAKEALWALERGYRLLKIKIGAAEHDVDVQSIAAIRESVGPNIGLRVDANGALSFSQALKLLKSLEPFNLELVEQPLPIGDLDGMARLIEISGMPIMPDESLHSPESALELVTRKAASIFGMKLAKHGGVYYAQKIAAIAQAAHQIPTIAETGLAGYQVDTWHGLVAPTGTPNDIVARLNKEVVAILQLPEMRESFAKLGALPSGNSSAEFAKEIKSEIARWGELIRQAGIKGG